MKRSKLLALSVSLAALSGACGHAGDVVTRSPEVAPLYLVQVVSAEVESVRPDGQPWDNSPRETRAPIVFALETPILSIAVGRGGQEGGPPNAPDPLVRIQCEGRRLEVPVAVDTFTPTWGYRFLIDPLVDQDGPVTLQLLDDDGDVQEGMGSVTLPMAQLLAGEHLELGPFGSVKRLELTVSPRTPAELQNFDLGPLEVAADAPTWLNPGIELYAGMHLAVAADGHVRLSRLSTGFWGPLGVSDAQLNGRWQAHNLDGFEGVRHGSLVAVIVDPGTGQVTQRLAIGDGLLTRVEGSGLLLLGVNDRDRVNNAGGFQVRLAGGPRAAVQAVALPQR